MKTVGFLDRSRTVAGSGWSRWLVPPAALSIHLAIGSAYAWSVFKIPLEKSLHISGTASALPFTIGIAVLGLSAPVFGTRVDRHGPRWAMFVATVCFCSGLPIAAYGVSIKQYWLVVVGYGVIGGIGLGIGYISPVSTLIKWFPDRPDMATGLAIMGFGGGALIASPWTNTLLNAFGRYTTAGVAKTFLVMGCTYAVFMSMGWLLVRVPARIARRRVVDAGIRPQAAGEAAMTDLSVHRPGLVMGRPTVRLRGLAARREDHPALRRLT